jgi:SAM-dependent methyltransferase
VRVGPPWHRYAHHIRELPAALEDLSRDLRVPTGARILDYGCADVPYRRFFAPDVEYVGADLPGNPDASLDLSPDGSVPVEDETFDAVLSTQVLEHVTDPRRYLAECHRVLRPGGRMLLSTHGIFVYHPDPDDYWRWTCAGLRRDVEGAGFEVERFEGIIGLAATGIQLAQDAVYWHLPRLLRPIFALCSQALVWLADRVESRDSRQLNAQVFALVAVKP